MIEWTNPRGWTTLAFPIAGQVCRWLGGCYECEEYRRGRKAGDGLTPYLDQELHIWNKQVLVYAQVAQLGEGSATKTYPAEKIGVVRRAHGDNGCMGRTWVTTSKILRTEA